MKKIKIYIVTYNAQDTINKNLKSLFASDIAKHNVEIYIINNHSNFSIDGEFIDKVKVLHNITRPDFSRGHLSRNWNQALINGFKDLSNPDCNIVACVQDDTLWYQDSIEKLINIHETYSFYTCTPGDGFCSYTPDAVKTIGLWDERFCGITFQEADYFLRAYLYNNAKSSINDSPHGRQLNPMYAIAWRNNTRDDNDRKLLSYIYHYSLELFKLKWPNNKFEYWDINEPMTAASAITNFVLYPYFEKNIDINNKNYLPLIWSN